MQQRQFSLHNLSMRKYFVIVLNDYGNDRIPWGKVVCLRRRCHTTQRESFGDINRQSRFRSDSEGLSDSHLLARDTDEGRMASFCRKSVWEWWGQGKVKFPSGQEHSEFCEKTVDVRIEWNCQTMAKRVVREVSSGKQWQDDSEKENTEQKREEIKRDATEPAF
jgi:hypothetical protein